MLCFIFFSVEGFSQSKITRPPSTRNVSKNKTPAPSQKKTVKSSAQPKVQNKKLSSEDGGGQSQSSYEQSNSSLNSSSSSGPRGYVDLGLPSGTYWKAINEGMYDWDTAMSKFGDKMPSQGQWEELKEYCTWTWTGSGYKVPGSNGQSIVLPAAGIRVCNGHMGNVGSGGGYWLTSPSGSEKACSIYFNSDGVYLANSSRCYGLSVCLVQD